MIKVHTLRIRMVLLFCGVVGALLVVSYLSVAILLAREVNRQLERQLLAIARHIIGDMQRSPEAGTVRRLHIPFQYFEVLDRSGKVQQLSINLRSHEFEIAKEHLPLSAPQFGFGSIWTGAPVRLAIVPFERGNDRLILVVGVPRREGEEVLWSYERIVAVLLPLSLLLAAGVSNWYVTKNLEPIAAITRHASRMARRISGRDGTQLWTPLTLGNPEDELGVLSKTFNQLFTRVDAAVCQLRQFVTDASHELRTPLSVLQGETELVLAEPRENEEYRHTLHIIDAELKKLARIVDGLFMLSMADAGQLRLAAEPLYMNEILEEACILATPAASAKSIKILRSLASEVPHEGDEAFLRQTFLILLNNAINYSPPHTSVHVSLQQNDNAVWVIVQDQGIGIAAADIPRIFERFYRVASSPTSESHSGGLGLAIAQAIVRAHGGVIECDSAVGCGSTFTTRFPVVAKNTNGSDSATTHEPEQVSSGGGSND